MSYKFFEQEKLSDYANPEYDSALVFEEAVSDMCHDSFGIKPCVNAQSLNEPFSPVLASFPSADCRWTNCTFFESSNNAGLPHIGTIGLPPLSSVFMNKPLLIEDAFNAKSSRPTECEGRVKKLQHVCEQQTDKNKVLNHSEVPQLMEDIAQQPLSSISNYLQSSYTSSFVEPRNRVSDSHAKLKFRKNPSLSQTHQSLPTSVNVAFKKLRTLIPTEPVDRRLSKVETLRLAVSYIQHLGKTLTTDYWVEQPCLNVTANDNDEATSSPICTFCMSKKRKLNSKIR